MPAGDWDGLAERFHADHERRHGYAMPDEPVDVVSLRVTATVEVETPDLEEEPGRGAEPADEREGPAIVELAEATCVVRPGWRGRVDDTGTLVLTR